MRKKMLDIPFYLVKTAFSVLLLLPISALAEGDGAWTTSASPGYIFLIEESMFNNEMHMSMTVLKPGYVGGESYWGQALASDASTYRLFPLNEGFDMTVTWEFNGVTQATVTVESCTTNCLWQPGQAVTLNKFFGDMKADPNVGSRVPKTGQTGCWDADGNSIDCTGTGQDGEYQYGVLPAVVPGCDQSGYCYAYTVSGWTGTRFTDNLDGTVTDNLTGLIWLKNANCTDTVGGISKTNGVLDWPNALNWCNALTSGTCGLTDSSSAGDWRLPNLNELHSLVDPNEEDPALPAGYSFTGVHGATYWSSTSGDVTWEVGTVLFSIGMVLYNSKSYEQSYPSAYVWPVRSGN